MSASLLVELYEQLPELRDGDAPRAWVTRMEKALTTFKKKVTARYTEGTLERLLTCADETTRRAAVLALGLMGTLASNEALAARLHDDDPMVRDLAGDALWAIWFRGDTEANNQELQRLSSLGSDEKALAGLDLLVKRAPQFAEAYNQRAIRHFQARKYEKSIADCEKVLQLNPYHFGAHAGLAQCYLKLRQPHAALKAYRAAHEINPNMEGVEEAIRALENALGEEGKK